MTPLVNVLLTVICFALLGCSTPSAKYEIDGNVGLSRDEAQNSLVEKYLQNQVSPALDAPIKVKKLILPPYPKELWQARTEGEVVVRFKINATGKIADVSVVGEANPILAALAIHSVLQWEFEQLKRNGESVSLWLNYKFIFRLV